MRQEGRNLLQFLHLLVKLYLRYIPSMLYIVVANRYSFILQLNFARYRRGLNGYRKSSPNVQVVGFKDSDTHADVLKKGAKGLDLTCACDLLLLVCSGGMVPDSPIEKKNPGCCASTFGNMGEIKTEAKESGGFAYQLI